MRLVVQRVLSAEVSLKGSQNVVGKIDKGLFILIGIGKNDTDENAVLLARKVLKLRVMSDNKDKMNLSVTDIRGSILVVSQFTLYADTASGNRPSFISSAEPVVARRVYDTFVKELHSSGLNVQTGSFGEYMHINTILDGPVTIIYG